MPIYEYLCPHCRRVFEEWTKTTEASSEEPCPACGALSPKVMSQTSFVLKGGGWYVDDYGYRKGIKEEGEIAPKSADDGQHAASDSAASGADSGGTESAGKADGNSVKKAEKAVVETVKPADVSEKSATEADKSAPRQASA